VGKSRPGIVYFSTEPETFRPISDVSTVHLVHFYPERDESRKISTRYRLFFNGNGKKIVNFWPWTVLPGKIRSHSAQVRWRLTEQIPFLYRFFLKLSRWNSVKDILERDRREGGREGGLKGDTRQTKVVFSSPICFWGHGQSYRCKF